MSRKEKDANGRKKFRWLKKARKNARNTERQPVRQEIAVPSEPAVSPEGAVLPETAPVQERPSLPSEKAVNKKLRVKENGALRQLWQYWHDSNPDERVYAIRADLDDTPDDHPLLLTDKEAALEAVLMGTALERWAELRCKQYRALKNDQKELRPMDAACWCYTSKTGMMAWVFTVPPLDGGRLLQPDDFKTALQSKGVTEGVDTAALAELQSRARYFSLVPVAWGKPMISGVDGSVIERYDRDFQPQMKVDEAGNVDYRDTVFIQLVTKGDVICDILPPKEGVAGMRIDGKPIVPKPVRPARFIVGSNVELSADGLRLVAAMDGHLEFRGNAFHVKPVLLIPGDIDYSSGNINFRGDVHIRGNVRERFWVRAAGVVTVDGLVEGATIEADGGIVVANGVFGSQQAFLRSRGNIRVKFLESCTVYAAGDVFADSIVSSRVYCDGSIQVTDGRGVILGGELHAASDLRARVVGSPNGSPLQIYLGTLSYAQHEIELNKRSIDEINEALAKVDQQLKKAWGDDEYNERAKMQLQHSVLELKREKLMKRQRELSGLNTQVERCRLECGVIYPGAVLNAGGIVKKFETPWNQCIAVYDAKINDIKFY